MYTVRTKIVLRNPGQYFSNHLKFQYEMLQICFAVLSTRKRNCRV